jgi:hypothetical protein
VKAAYDLAASKAASSHTHSQYLDTDINYNAVGSLCFAWNKSTSQVLPGSTLAGSNLIPAGLSAQTYMNGSNAYPAYIAATGTAMSGTWRCLGYSFRGTAGDTGTLQTATLWQRIS